MNYEQFIFWLKGYLEDNKKPDSEIIKEKLQQVIVPYPTKIYFPDNANEIYKNCHCNPLNGGSGVCNCILSTPSVTSSTVTKK